jgi:hypothetical protein
LLESMVSNRLDRLVSELNLRSADHTDIEEALSAALMVCANDPRSRRAIRRLRGGRG